MDNQRLFIVVGLFLTGFLFWSDYQASLIAKDKPQPNSVINSNLTSSSQVDVPNQITPVVNSNSNNEDVPTNVADFATPEVIATQNNDQDISVHTDLFSLNISKKGGTINKLLLNSYPVSLDDPEVVVQLFNSQPNKLFLAQSGLISKSGLPNHHDIYKAQQSSYELGANPSLSLPLYWTNNAGLQVVKTYTFTQGSYLIGLSYDIINNSKQAITYASYAQLLKTDTEEGNLMLPTYSGGAVYNDQEIYEKIAFDDFKTQPPIESKGGWLAMIQHYFVAAWVPEQEKTQRYSSKELNNGASLLSVVNPSAQLAAGARIHIEPNELYVGPKLQKQISGIPGLDKSVDYTFLYIIAKPLEIVLHWIYDVVVSWGWAIILLTVLIKLVFYKLSETSYRSMAKMRKLAPKMAQLKELYGDDKQKISQKMMALYKEEKVNPAAGCLPILVQIPVFISLYWVLLESVELRHVSFWWLSDLTAQDPLYILPVLMGISMYIQQKLNPVPPDPMQAKIMATLPFVFTIFFFWMPSGLVLYWVVNNILSIAQQWVINKRIGAD